MERYSDETPIKPEDIPGLVPDDELVEPTDRFAAAGSRPAVISNLSRTRLQGSTSEERRSRPYHLTSESRERRAFLDAWARDMREAQERRAEEDAAYAQARAIGRHALSIHEPVNDGVASQEQSAPVEARHRATPAIPGGMHLPPRTFYPE